MSLLFHYFKQKESGNSAHWFIMWAVVKINCLLLQKIKLSVLWGSYRFTEFRSNQHLIMQNCSGIGFIKITKISFKDQVKKQSGHFLSFQRFCKYPSCSFVRANMCVCVYIYIIQYTCDIMCVCAMCDVVWCCMLNYVARFCIEWQLHCLCGWVIERFLFYSSTQNLHTTWPLGRKCVNGWNWNILQGMPQLLFISWFEGWPQHLISYISYVPGLIICSRTFTCSSTSRSSVGLTLAA